MARDHARIHLSIWDDPDFLALPVAQQWTYLALAASPFLSYCGVHPLVPAKIAERAGDMTERKVSAALRGLADARFIVPDPSTAELAIRTYVYWDGVLKMPNVVRAMNRAYAKVMSELLRGVIRDETHRAIWRTFPDGPPEGVAKAIDEGFAEGFREGFSEGVSHSPSPFPLPPSPISGHQGQERPLGDVLIGGSR